MDAPQSAIDIAPIVAAVQRLDARLDVVWNPRAVMVTRGSYSVDGAVVAPVYDGRWEVILNDTQVKTAEWRAHTRVCLVTEPVEVAHGLMAMTADGPYAPVGWWLVEFLEAADSWNQAKARYVSDRLEELNAVMDARRQAEHDEATREAAAQLYHAGTKAGGGVSELHPVTLTLTK